MQAASVRTALAAWSLGAENKHGIVSRYTYSKTLELKYEAALCARLTQRLADLEQSVACET